jgi:hypothetical protein
MLYLLLNIVPTIVTSDNSTMANTLCAFTSINDVLAKADMDHLNITTLVSSCPDICTLAWGTGNPDLSGIGANISYIFQAILTFIFGPLLCFTYICHKKFTKFANERLEKLQDTFMDISAQFSITVAIAAVIRSYQHPPYYELAFLRSLITMQFLSLLATAVTIGICKKHKDPLTTRPVSDTSEEGRKERKGAPRITVIIIYSLIEFGCYVGLLGRLRVSKASWTTLSELNEACKAYSHIVPWSVYIPPPLHLPHIGSARDYFGKKGVKFVWTIIGLCLAAIVCLFIAAGVLFLLASVLLSQKEILVGPISLAFSVGMLVATVKMEHTRQIMKAVTGVEFQDNQWGFGQVIALFLWVPLIIQMFYYGICELALLQLSCHSLQLMPASSNRNRVSGPNNRNEPWGLRDN